MTSIKVEREKEKVRSGISAGAGRSLMFPAQCSTIHNCWINSRRSRNRYAPRAASTESADSLTKSKPSHIPPSVRQSPPFLPGTLSLTPGGGAVAKTRTQLNRRLPDGQKLGWPPFGKAWYAGCTTLIIGNSLKAGIRMETEGSRGGSRLTRCRLRCIRHVQNTVAR